MTGSFKGSFKGCVKGSIGFRVESLGCWVSGLGLKVCFRVRGLRLFRVCNKEGGVISNVIFQRFLL